MGMRGLRRSILILSALVAINGGGAIAQDITNLGGDLTSSFPPSTALELPAPNMSSRELFEAHLEGHNLFHGSFEFFQKDSRRVIGPTFNHTSCGGCHIKDGRGPIKFSKRLPGSAMLVKVSLRGLNPDGSPRNIPGMVEQLQDHTIGGRNRFDIDLRWRTVRGKYPDGSSYTLRRPVLSFDIPSARKKSVVTSLRMTPPVIGMGLLEAVPAATLVALSDPDDLNGDGISGRVRYVSNRETQGTDVGRFGFRASHPTVKQQSAAAFFNDMGMTSELFTDTKQPIEVTADVMDKVVFYQQAAGVTPARDQDNPDVIAGKQLFQQVNCSGCHVMTLTTGDTPIVEVSNQEFHPFTDLLLHDMGPGLSDKRVEFDLSGREWRTTPLWGLGLHDYLSTKRPGYLHDGRARTIEEAILWHGGEAKRSRDDFKALNASERAQLLRFLESL